MEKWGESYYNGSKIRREGKVASIKDPFNLGYPVYSHGAHSHYFYCCNQELRPGLMCSFCIRKDVITRELKTNPDFIDKIKHHKHQAQSIDQYFVQSKEDDYQLQPLEEDIYEFMTDANISFRKITSPIFYKLIQDAIRIGQQHPTCSIDELMPKIRDRKAAREQYITLSKKNYVSCLDSYAKMPGSCLTADGGKHHTIPYLIICLSNCMYKDVPPLVLEACRYFEGKTLDYVNIFTNICEKLVASHVSIAGIVTDNLPAQTYSVNFTDERSFQKKSSNPSIRGIIWLSCSCHSLALTLNDIEDACPYGLFNNSIRKTVQFLRCKLMTNYVKRICPLPCKTRWTGIFDCCLWILKNREYLNCLFKECMNHDSCYDIPDFVIDGINIVSPKLFVFLLPYKTVSRKLEAESMQACYVFPLIISAINETQRLVNHFNLPGSLAVRIKQSITARFLNSQTGRILKLLFFATPLGRLWFRSHPDEGCVIHGTDVELDSTIIELKYSEEDESFLELIEKNDDSFVDDCNCLRSAFASYEGKLIDPRSGKKCVHSSTHPFDTDPPLSEEETEQAEKDPSFNPSYSSDITEDVELFEEDEDPEWIKERTEHVLDFLSDDLADSSSDDSESYTEEPSGNINDSDDNDDIELEEVINESRGHFDDSMIALQEIATSRGYNAEEVASLKVYFADWLTDTPQNTIPYPELLCKGVRYWEFLTNNIEHKQFAKFILPLFSLSGSEAIVERIFWYQRRILGDTSMRMSKSLEKARLNAILKNRMLKK